MGKENIVSEAPQSRWSFAKVVVVMAVSFLVGLGLCGLDFALAANGIGKGTEEFSVGPLDGISLVVMVLSAAGLVLSLILWGLVAIVRSMGSQNGEQ
jgi:hypothetical protein